MIQIKSAYEIYLNRFPKRKVIGMLDVGDAYIIQAEEGSGVPIDSAPIAVSKETGELKTFFPPHNREKLKKARQISLDEIF